VAFISSNTTMVF